MLIKDLLDSHDDLNDHFEELLTKFSQGKRLSHAPRSLKPSKRDLKDRPHIAQQKKKKASKYRPMDFLP